MKRLFRYPLQNESGATMVEYAIILGILVAVFVGISALLQQAAMKREELGTGGDRYVLPDIPGGTAGYDQVLKETDEI